MDMAPDWYREAWEASDYGQQGVEYKDWLDCTVKHPLALNWYQQLCYQLITITLSQVIHPGVNGSLRRNMDKQDVFFIVLYGSFFAVMMTFIISFDETSGFGEPNKIHALYQLLTKSGQDDGAEPLSFSKWDGGEGDKK